MTATITTTHELTREDIAALREADDIVFHTNSTAGAVIHAELSGMSGTRIYTAREQRRYPLPGGDLNERRRVIACGVEMWGQGSGGLDAAWNHEHHPEASGFVWLKSPNSSGVSWATTASLLKPGDTLTLRWIADQQATDTLRSAGLHLDSLELLVHRGERRLVFDVATRVSGDHSGRMVKRYGG